jgi:hypothetical protein
MQALYEAILEDERILEEAFTCEVLARQAEASDDQALIGFSAECVMRTAAAPREPSKPWPSSCPSKVHINRKEERRDATEGQERCP